VLTTHYPDLWLLVLGGLFVAVVLFIPDGLVGTARKLLRRSGIRRGVSTRFVGRPDEARRAEEAKPRTEAPHVQAR
jgi:hypothetical protein